MRQAEQRARSAWRLADVLALKTADTNEPSNDTQKAAFPGSRRSAATRSATTIAPAELDT
jgi:hypothetical protein